MRELRDHIYIHGKIVRQRGAYRFIIFDHSAVIDMEEHRRNDTYAVRTDAVRVFCKTDRTVLTHCTDVDENRYAAGGFFDNGFGDEFALFGGHRKHFTRRTARIQTVNAFLN